MARSTDTGRLTERIASVAPAELHRELVAAAVAALRDGAPVELLDGLQYWRASDLTHQITDTRARRLAALEVDLVAARAAYRQARANANTTRNERLRSDYLADAEREAERIDQLEADLAAERDRPADRSEPESFDSDCDFLAHALAGLVHHGEHAPRELADALSTVVQFSAFRPVHTTDPPQLEVEFCLLLPADGRVARFGPITCRITNRAYRNTLRDTGDTQRLRAWLAHRHVAAGHQHLDTAPHRAVQFLAEQLESVAGWTQLAARTLARSGLEPLYAIATHLLWGDSVPDDLDPGYVELVTSTYGSADFGWNRRHHALDCSLRQRCVDAAVAAGGHIACVDLEAALADTKVDAVRITVYSRPQTLGGAPTWEPCLERHGDWIQQHPKSGRSLSAIACPHCGGWASRVVRTPETPACLLCPACRRMPTADSPVFPDPYLRL